MQTVPKQVTVCVSVYVADKEQRGGVPTTRAHRAHYRRGGAIYIYIYIYKPFVKNYNPNKHTHTSTQEAATVSNLSRVCM